VDFCTQAPGQELWISRHILDETEHVHCGMKNEGSPFDFHACVLGKSMQGAASIA
jgi:hypothetical protein